ncbi:MAG: DNA internalization-related competence protein ComEC/Rec2, partial [Bacteroidota bacterium]
MKLPHNVYVLIVLSIGIIIASLVPALPLPWLLIGLFLIAIGMIQQIYRSNLGWLLLLFCLVGAGFWFSYTRSVYLDQVKFNQVFHNQAILVDGTIVSRPEPTRAGFWFVMRLETGSSGRLFLPRGQVSVFINDPPSDGWYGRKVKIKGRFRAIPPKATGFPDYSEIHSISGSISAHEPPQFQTGFGLIPPFIWADQIRQRMTDYGERVIEPGNARLLHGILFGDSLGDTEDRFIVNLQRTSTIHMLSVSGMHVGFVAVSLSFLLGLLKIPKRWQVGPLIIGVWFYIMMTGMDPPALRAGVMLTIVLIGNILQVGDIPINRLSLAAIVLLLMNPYNLFDPSFQLTFAATFGVSCLYPLLVEYLPVKRKFLALPWKALLVSLSAQLMFIPILIHYFQMISWVSPLANIILIFPGEVAVIGGLVGEVIGNLQPSLGGLVLALIQQLLNLIRVFINWLGSFSWAASWSPQWPWPWVAGYYLGLTLFIDSIRPNILNRKQRQFKLGPILIGLMLFVNLVVWSVYYYQIRGEYLQVIFFDVGQGDATLLRSPNGKYALVDGGDKGRGKRAILPYFQKTGIMGLEMVVLTHYHQDHWGGLIEVLNKIPTKAVLAPPAKETESYFSFEAGIKSTPIRRRTIHKGMIFKMGKGASLEVLEVPDLESENDRSIVLLVSFGKIRLLLTGDLSFKGEELLLKSFPHLLNASLLKVGHHGSNYASGLLFLSQIKPGLAIISVGAENRYEHPGPATVNRLRSLGVKILRTDSLGIIDCRIY